MGLACRVAGTIEAAHSVAESSQLCTSAETLNVHSMAAACKITA